MPGFDPLGIRATDWRAVGMGVLRIVIVLPLVVGTICVSCTILTNPTAYAPFWRVMAWALLVLRLIRTPREAQETADEIQRIQGEFTKLEPPSQHDKVRQQIERKREP